VAEDGVVRLLLDGIAGDVELRSRDPRRARLRAAARRGDEVQCEGEGGGEVGNVVLVQVDAARDAGTPEPRS
jgi:hypothetical protein